MKKIVKIVIFAMILCMCTLVSTTVYAQTLNLNITQVEEGDHLQYCETLYDSVNVSKDSSCNGSIHWRITYYPEGTATDYYTDDVTFPFNSTYEKVMVQYWGCDTQGKWFQIYPLSFENILEPWIEEDTKWLNQGDTLELEVNYSPTLNYVWPNGSTDWHYTITGPEMSGKVWVRMYNDCGSVSDTINVYYNPEPKTVTVDPNTGNLIVTWDVNPTMSTYIQWIDIYRDGFVQPIARVDYTAGQYIDQEANGNTTSRYYSFRGVTFDGAVCDHDSEAKPSIHADYTLAINDDIVIIFNNVANKYEDLTNYYISEWDGNNATHIDSVGIRNGTIVWASNDKFTVNRDGTIQYRAPSYYFNPDSYLIVEAGFNNGKDGRSIPELCSNKSEGTVSVKAFFEVKCSIFPNPATHQFTVMGLETGTLTLYNQLGQVILTQEISGETIIGVNGLPSGVYFAKISTPLGVCTEQVVVE